MTKYNDTAYRLPCHTTTSVFTKPTIKQYIWSQIKWGEGAIFVFTYLHIVRPPHLWIEEKNGKPVLSLQTPRFLHWSSRNANDPTPLLDIKDPTLLFGRIGQEVASVWSDISYFRASISTFDYTEIAPFFKESANILGFNVLSWI